MKTQKITLKDAKAGRAWNYFREISKIPRCSKNETQIIAWLKDLAERRGLKYKNDNAGNVLIELPATIGLENVPAVVIQSHVDMVCEKTPESKHDFSKDPIEIIERDGWITAKNTTLGADNGIGVALALGLIDEQIQHPKLELLFTVDEETGLTGANALRQGFITGKYLVNLDGEDESFIVGCAGGEQAEITIKLDYGDALDGLECYILKAAGLHGGHSGIDIDKNYANVIKLLVKTLIILQEKIDIRLSSIDAGKAANAIPRDANAAVFLASSDIGIANRMLADAEAVFKKEFAATEPNLKIELVKATEAIEKQIINNKSEIINLLSALPTGVYRMSDEFKGMVETSNNLARVETDRNAGLLRIVTMQRGFMPSSMDELTGQIASIAEAAGAEVEISNRYQAWIPDKASTLLKRAKAVYERLYKKEPEVIVVHAGLEPAVIGNKFPGMEMISTGATIENLHSPRERVNIASVDSAWGFLRELLSELSS